MQLFAGKPSKFHSHHVTFSEDELKELLGDTSNIGIGSLGGSRASKRPASTDPDDEVDIRAIPGMLLNRLNPLKGLDDEQRKAFIIGVPAQVRGVRQP